MIRLDPATDLDLEALAARLRSSRSAVVRRAVRELAARELPPPPPPGPAAQQIAQKSA